MTHALDASIAAHAFSGVVSIRRADRTLYERAAGYADRSQGIENTARTRFGIASGTKFLTALAIGRLIAEGRLAFETRLADCVSLGFPHYPPEITIRHLLNHTSGIPDYYDEELITDFDQFLLGVPNYVLKRPRDYLAIFPNEPLKSRPGERYSYSNGGYILLGVVLEEVTGRSYQEFVEQEVLGPAGMHRSGFFSFDRLPAETALGYIEDQTGWRTNIYNLPIVGASDGGAYTTTQDVTRLWQAFWAGEILPRDLVEIYTTPFVNAEVEGAHTHYSHGLWLRDCPGRTREFYLTGCDAGVSFRSSVYPEVGLEITLLSNTTDGAWPVAAAIEAALFGGDEPGDGPDGSPAAAGA